MATYAAKIVPEPPADAPGVFRQVEGAGPGVVTVTMPDDPSLPLIEIMCGGCETLLVDGREGGQRLFAHGFLYQCWQCRLFNQVGSLKLRS